MQQTIGLSNPHLALFQDEAVEKLYQKELDLLAQKKSNWTRFYEKVASPLKAARLVSIRHGWTLFHLAVLDEQLPLIEQLAKEPQLKWRRDNFGLSPLDLAQILHNPAVLNLFHLGKRGGERVSFPPSCQIEYLSHPIFRSKEEFELILYQIEKAKKEDLVPAEKIWMGIYFDKELSEHCHPPVSIQWINDQKGYGVVAGQKISPCSFVGEYSGVVYETSTKQLKDKKYCLRYNLWKKNKHFTIDAEEKGNFTRFFNHSETGNLVLQSVYWRGLVRMIFVALTEIQKDEELTFHYGPLYEF